MTVFSFFFDLWLTAGHEQLLQDSHRLAQRFVSSFLCDTRRILHTFMLPPNRLENELWLIWQRRPERLRPFINSCDVTQWTTSGLLLAKQVVSQINCGMNKIIRDIICIVRLRAVCHLRDAQTIVVRVPSVTCSECHGFG